MILVTGGTGFIGKALVRHLSEAGYPVRLLIHPSRKSPNLPRGIPVEVAVSTITDARGLRSAMVGVTHVYHLAGAEWSGPWGSLLEVDIKGTQAVCQAAIDAGVRRIFYVSHLGADRASAYPVIKAKGIAEEHIRRSGLDFTILRSAIVYGHGDAFTTGIARLLRSFPIFFLMPEDGKTLLQPLWVEDLATCLVWALDIEAARGQTYSLGGPEYLPFNQVVTEIMQATNLRRRIVYLYPPFLRIVTVFLEYLFPRLPISVYWLDYLAVNRTAALDTLPRLFSLMPGRFHNHLEYLSMPRLQTTRTRSATRGK